MNTKNNFKHIKEFIEYNFRHFNAFSLKNASETYVDFLKKGNKMLITIAGAMSTAELGITLAEMIRKDKIHAICCTGANLEEDLYNLVAHEHYMQIPNYRCLSIEAEEELFKRKLCRVVDTCIPEEEAIKRINKYMVNLWMESEKSGKRYFVYEYVYQLLRSGTLEQYYQIDSKNSWVVAACEKNIPIFVPGWEDSTLGNFFAAKIKKGEIFNPHIIKSGIEVMDSLISWYKENSKENSIGFLQIGGGIAGDFPICVVPLIQVDLKEECKKWGYFCQISESSTSYGSYSGAAPNEKISWGKLDKDTPKFVIESDATIVAPLMFAYVLGSE